MTDIHTSRPPDSGEGGDEFCITMDLLHDSGICSFGYNYNPVHDIMQGGHIYKYINMHGCA